MKVLLVEDHPGLAKISCDLLKNFFGHEVAHASTGTAAFEVATRNIPDLVLIDLNLPDMHGYRLAEKMREQPCFDKTILVALTGHGITGNAERSKAAGIDAHYRKPMDFGELVNLRRVSGNSQHGLSDELSAKKIPDHEAKATNAGQSHRRK